MRCFIFLIKNIYHPNPKIKLYERSKSYKIHNQTNHLIFYKFKFHKLDGIQGLAIFSKKKKIRWNFLL